MLFHIKEYLESVLFLEIVDAARSEFSCDR